MQVLVITPAEAVSYKCINEQGQVFYQQTPCGDKGDGAQPYRVDRYTPPPGNDQTTPGQTPVAKQTPSVAQQQTHILDTNLLLNPDFEKQLAHWQHVADAHWLPSNGENNSGVLQMQARKPPEDKYIHETVVSQCVIIRDAVEFTLGGQYRHEGSPIKDYANRLRVYWFESENCTTGGQFGTYVEPKNVSGWQRLSIQKIKPSLLAKSARVEIMQNGRYSNGGKGYWDNVYLLVTKVSDAKSRLPGYSLPVDFDFIENGAFSQNLSAWRTWHSEWVAYTGNKKPGAIKVTLVSTQGSMGTGVAQQCVNYGASKYFEAGASYKQAENNAQQGSGRLRVTWYQGADCRGRAKTDRHADPVGSAGWQMLQVKDLVAPEGALSAKVEVIQSIAGQGIYSAYWDDIYFKTSPTRK